MIRPGRLLLWLLIVILAGGVVIGLGVEELGVCSATYTVEVVGPNPSPVRRAEWEYMSTRDEADQVARALTENPGAALDGRPADLVSDRSFVISGLATSRRSAFRSQYIYREWAVIVVELSDGTRHVRALHLPDPRPRPTITFTLD